MVKSAACRCLSLSQTLRCPAQSSLMGTRPLHQSCSVRLKYADFGPGYLLHALASGDVDAVHHLNSDCLHAPGGLPKSRVLTIYL
jgi:hypothetical protein